MASNARAVLAAVGEALAGINGAGGYTYDLSAAGSVVCGAPTEAEGPTPPVAFYAFGDLASEHGRQIGRYQRNIVIDILGVVPTSADTAEARQFAGADLLDDICKALETDRTLGGLLKDIIVEGATFSGAGVGYTGCAAVYATVRGYYFSNSAAGV